MLYLSVKTLGAFSNWQADMKVGRRGRNPAPLMAKMESTSDIRGGPNLTCCCDRLLNFRWRPGFDSETRVSAIWEGNIGIPLQVEIRHLTRLIALTVPSFEGLPRSLTQQARFDYSILLEGGPRLPSKTRMAHFRVSGHIYQL